MKQYLHGVVWIVFTVAVILTSSPAAGANEQFAVGGLYRNGELVDSFVEPIPSLGASAKAEAHTLNAAPASSETQIFRQRVQPPIPGAETQSRNRAFARAADAGAKMQELLRRMSARRGEDLGTDRQSLQALLQEFEAMHADVHEALSRVGDRVIELGLDQSIHQRHLNAVKAFEQGNKKLRTAIGNVIDGKPGALQRALDLMQRLKFRDDPPLLNSGLPFQKHVLEAPRLTRQQADSVQEAAAQAGVRPAAMAIDPPTPDDLAETPDIQFTPEITAKAAELGNSPLAIYEFVRNNVSFEAYLGSRKGAANSLEQLRGNDTDQASLLLALLRVSGIPSRYVRGTVEMAPEPTMSWLGVDDAATAASILTTAGLDGVAIVNGPDVVAIRSTHVWVEAYMPYSNYRGIPNDDTGKTWVPIDPSFKGNDITLGEDILTPMGFDVNNFITGYISTVSDPDPLEQLELDIQAYLDANDPGKTVADIERKRQLAPQLLGLLPASSSYAVRQISDRFPELEASKRYKVRFHLYDGGTDFIDHTIDLPELAGKRFTIEYVGAAPADQATIDSFGGIYETPPNLVDVKPVLDLDGVAIATSINSIGMGYTHSSDMEFIAPAGASNVQPLVQNQIIAGNGQAIGFDTFLDVHDAFLGGDPDFPAEDFLEAILHTTAIDYLSRVDRGLEKAERLMRVVTTQDVSEAIVENAIAVSYSFGVPVTFEWTGLIVDADRRIIGTFDVDGDGSQDLPYMKLTGIHGSLMENRVFEEMFDQDAVSTIKILQLASDAGIGICTIENSVYGDCPGITQPSHIISALNAALAKGHVITIPEDPITVGLWSGTGYIDLDPSTGAGGYIISGGISGAVQTDSGGATVESWPVTLPCEATSVTGNVLDPAADSPDPSAVFCADNTHLSFKVEFTTTCKDGSTKTHQQTFTTSKTKEQIGGGNYTLQLVAFGSETIIRKITIIEFHVDIHSTDTDSYKIPSNLGATGLDHFVAAKGTGDLILDAGIVPDNQNAKDAISWVATGATITSPGVGTDKATAKLSTSIAKKISVQIKVNGNICWEGKCWVVWANMSGSVASPVTTSLFSGSGLRIGTNVSSTITPSATITPVEIITDSDRPDLQGGNVPPALTGANSCGTSLAGGVNARWDISRRIAIRAETSPSGLALACLDNTDDFPTDPVEGNDDAGTGDPEDNNPYSSPNIGKLTGDDSPARSGPNNGALSNGNVGDTYRTRLWFQEFARLQLGPSGSAKWYVISDPLLWRVEYKFKKIQVTEALWGIDANGDGDQLDDITEAMIGIDTNGDGDQSDNIGYWDNDGSTSANDNAGAP